MTRQEYLSDVIPGIARFFPSNESNEAIIDLWFRKVFHGLGLRDAGLVIEEVACTCQRRTPHLKDFREARDRLMASRSNAAPRPDADFWRCQWSHANPRIAMSLRAASEDEIEVMRAKAELDASIRFYGPNRRLCAERWRRWQNALIRWQRTGETRIPRIDQWDTETIAEYEMYAIHVDLIGVPETDKSFTMGHWPGKD